MKFSSYKLQEILSELKPLQRGDELLINCPECEHRECYLSVSKNNHAWQCWRKVHCGATGNIYTLLYKIGKQSYLFDQAPNIHQKLVLAQPKKLILDVPAIPKPIGYQRIQYHPYLRSRQLDVHEKFEFGITRTELSLRDRLIFLVYENGELKGYCARDITDKKKNKYYNTPNVDFGKLLYGIDDIQCDTKTVILVEGIFDKINVDNLLGLPNVYDIKCVATFGNKISEEQIKKLHNKCPNCSVILMYDPDAIGQMQQYSFNVALKFHTQIAKITCGKKKDPGNMSQTELLSTLGNLWSPFDYFIGHLNVEINESRNHIRT